MKTLLAIGLSIAAYGFTLHYLGIPYETTPENCQTPPGFDCETWEHYRNRETQTITRITR